MRNPVVGGQPFIKPGAVGPQQSEHTAVVFHDVLKLQARFHPQGFPEVVIKVRKQTGVGGDGLQIAQIKPLIREIRHQRLRPRIAQHTAGLGLHIQSACQKRFIGNAAPKKKRKPGGQFKIAQLVGGPGLVLLGAEQELPTDQDCRQRRFDARFKRGRSGHERFQPGKIFLGHGPSVGSLQDRHQH